MYRRFVTLAASLGLAVAVLPAMVASAPPAAAAVVGCASNCPNQIWEVERGGANIKESSPGLIDLDGDGVLDVAVGGNNGLLYGLRGTDGSDAPGWPQNLGHGINSSPSVADVDGDGATEIFVGSGLHTSSNGALWSLRRNGSQRFRFVANEAGDSPFRNPSVHSTPAIGDLDNDNRADVAFGTLGLRSNWALDRDGGTKWNHYADDTVFSSPALVDVNNDGFSDVVIGGDSTAGAPVDHEGGVLRALDGRNGNELWRLFTTNAIVRSSPAVGDIDGDGVPEIVVGTGDYNGPAGAPGPDSRVVRAVTLGGQIKWSVSLDGFTLGSPALADVDGDGVRDVVIGTANNAASTGTVYVLGGNGAIKRSFSSGSGVIVGSIVTADLNGNGRQDMLVPTGGRFVAFADDGTKLWSINDGQIGYQNSAAIADIDGNGRLDLLFAGTRPGNGNGVITRLEMPASQPGTAGATSWPQFRHDARRTGSTLNPPLTKSLCPAAGGGGYRLVARDGGIFSFCDAKFFGSTGAIKLNQPIVGMATTNDTNGYWLVASDGGIFAFGNAKFFGSTGAIKLNQPIVGMARTPSGNGYWLVARDGGIFAFGDAKFFGSTGAIKLNQPIVGMSATPSGNGYWLVASDGGIFAFGDAAFRGSTGAIKLNQPIVGMEATPSGSGYWLVATDGGIFAFGDAAFRGSTGAIKLNQPIVGMARTGNGGGYWLVASDGGIFAFGNAPFLGSTGSLKLNQPIVGMAA